MPMRDSAFPGAPDWQWLREHYSGTHLLFWNVPLFDIAPRLHHGISVLALPQSSTLFRDVDLPLAKTVDGADAAHWLLQLELAGCRAVAPGALRRAMIAADHAGMLDPDDGAYWADHARAYIAQATAVVVPSCAGWAESRDVWKCACDALWIGRRVAVLAEDLEKKRPVRPASHELMEVAA